MAEQRRLASMVSVRLSPEEAAQVRQAADLAGESVSGFIRHSALARTGCLPAIAFAAGQVLETRAIAQGTMTFVLSGVSNDNVSGSLPPLAPEFSRA